ncbi:MAG: hypothetical protein FE78DRAFT_418900 [Acidomyces sp. 'richmondensis']|nr:MAG: hypothetical protein FE78DRAFT_418900 [Acidomyces sp. 'richmondensis']
MLPTFGATHHSSALPYTFLLLWIVVDRPSVTCPKELSDSIRLMNGHLHMIEVSCRRNRRSFPKRCASAWPNARMRERRSCKPANLAISSNRGVGVEILPAPALSLPSGRAAVSESRCQCAPYWLGEGKQKKKK